jgi:para-nitrobenzyl esterase
MILENAGLRESSAEALLSLAAESIVAAQRATSTVLVTQAASGDFTPGILPFQPVVGGAALPVAPLDAVRDGSASGVRLIAGTTTEEWKLFALMAVAAGHLDDTALVDRVARVLGEGAGQVIDAYAANRSGMSPHDLFSAVATDYAFRIPTIRLLEAQATHRSEVHCYEFGHRSTAWGGALGACHAIEIPFVFDNLDRRGTTMFVGEVGDHERGLATEMSDAWLAFARGDEPWPRYDLDCRATRRFGGDDPGVHDDPHGDERELWATLR